MSSVIKELEAIEDRKLETTILESRYKQVKRRYRRLKLLKDLSKLMCKN